MSTRFTIALGAALVLLSSVSIAVAKTDKDFLSDAIQGNLGEISVGQLAQQNGNSDGVRSFGQMLVQDHSAANEKALQLAKSHDLTPPSEPKGEAKQVHDNPSPEQLRAFTEEMPQTKRTGFGNVNVQTRATSDSSRSLGASVVPS